MDVDEKPRADNSAESPTSVLEDEVFSVSLLWLCALDFFFVPLDFLDTAKDTVWIF